MVTDSAEVSISDGKSALLLVRVGEPERGYPATSYPTRVDLRSGPFSVSVTAYAQSYSNFRKALEQLHTSMKGDARLSFWMEEHQVVLEGNGRGTISVLAKITDSRSPSNACLTVTMSIDQSYLPDLIASIRRTFPEPLD